MFFFNREDELSISKLVPIIGIRLTLDESRDPALMHDVTESKWNWVSAEKPRLFRFALVSSMALLACGCHLSRWSHNKLKVGPEYGGPPSVEIAATWIDQDERLVDDLPAYSDWWSVFNDPLLDRLIQTASEQNLTLREAGWRVMQARAQWAITAGNLFPQTQQAFGDFERFQESTTVAIPSPIRNFDQWTTGFNLSWELDVWGRFRRSIVAAEADVEASEGDYDAILLCLLADVASAYTDFRTNQLRLQYAQNNVKIQEGSLQLTKKKADEGATGYTSVHLAASSLETTRSSIPNYEIGMRQAANRLCTLLGISMQDLQGLLGQGDIPRPPPGIAVGIPADLLRRRPDIRALERTLAAQSEQIGIATADLYPHFSINGEIGLQSENFSQLFSSASMFGSVGPSFKWNLLNYGRIINNVRLQGFGLEALVANYRNTVLTANQEVEDAMIAVVKNHDRVRYLEVAVKESEEALKLLTISFEEGDIDFTGVFLMQGVVATNQDQLAAARGSVVRSLISLYKALGGGWEMRYSNFESRQDIEMVSESAAAMEPEEIPLPPTAAEATPPATIEEQQD